MFLHIMQSLGEKGSVFTQKKKKKKKGKKGSWIMGWTELVHSSLIPAVVFVGKKKKKVAKILYESDTDIGSREL